MLKFNFSERNTVGAGLVPARLLRETLCSSLIFQSYPKRTYNQL
jgi:hypothetical protein